MADDMELQHFVRESLARGIPRVQVEEALLRAGWSTDRVKSALALFAELDFPIPVPRPKPYLSAREAFMYLVLFTTLYICAYNLGSLLFQFINRAYPDPAISAYLKNYTHKEIRWSVANLIIAFPVFLYVSRLLGNAIAFDPNKRASKVRKWLTYMTLFIAAGVIIGDLIALVYNFLSGELTMRILLKVLTVGSISSVVFGFYLWDLRQDDVETAS